MISSLKYGSDQKLKTKKSSCQVKLLLLSRDSLGILEMDFEGFFLVNLNPALCVYLAGTDFAGTQTRRV